MLAIFLLHKKTAYSKAPLSEESVESSAPSLPLLCVLLRKFPRNSDTPRVRARVFLTKLRVQQTQRPLIATMRLRFVMATNLCLAFRAYATERGLMPFSSLSFILAPLASLP
jgi:hypothetical protein